MFSEKLVNFLLSFYFFPSHIIFKVVNYNLKLCIPAMSLIETKMSSNLRQKLVRR